MLNSNKMPINKSILITMEQEEYVQDHSINLSRFVRNAIDVEIENGKI